MGLINRLRDKAGISPLSEAEANAVDGDVLYAEVQTRMKELEHRHARGELSDAEYAAEHDKVIDEL